jgi:endoglycosylceramidase
VKIPPYLPDVLTFDPYMSLTDQDIQNLYDWGTNIIRLGVIWEAVEKQPGVYDFDYLDQVEDLINRLAQKNIYTIVDSH